MKQTISERMFCTILVNLLFFTAMRTEAMPKTGPMPRNRTIQVVILPFDEVVTDSVHRFTWLEKDIVRMLNTELSKFGKLNISVLFREKLAALGLESVLASIYQDRDGVLVDDPGSVIETLKKSGHFQSADYIILGSFRVFRDFMRIDAHLIDIQTTEILTSVPMHFQTGRLLYEITAFGEILYQTMDRLFNPRDQMIVTLLPFEGEDQELCQNIYIHMNAEMYRIVRHSNIQNLVIKQILPGQQEIIDAFHDRSKSAIDLGRELASDYLIETNMIMMHEPEESLKLCYSLQGLNDSSSKDGNDFIQTTETEYQHDVPGLCVKMLKDLGFEDIVAEEQVSEDSAAYAVDREASPFEILRSGIVLFDQKKYELAEERFMKAASNRETSDLANFYIGEIRGKQNNFFEQFKYQYKSVKRNRIYISFEVKLMPVLLQSRIDSDFRGDVGFLYNESHFYLPKFQAGYKLTPNVMLNLGIGFWYRNVPWASAKPFQYSYSGTLDAVRKDPYTGNYEDLTYNFTLYHNYLQEYDFSFTYFFLPELSERELIPYFNFGLRYTRITPYLDGYCRTGQGDYGLIKSSGYLEPEDVLQPFAVLGIEYFLTRRRPTAFGDLALYFYGEVIRPRNFSVRSPDLPEMTSSIRLGEVAFNMGMKTSKPLFMITIPYYFVLFVVDLF